MTKKESAKDAVKVTRVPLASLVSDPKNARKHDAKNMQAITKSIERFGAGRSLVVDGQNIVRAGNGTLEAAMEAGVSDAIVVDATGNQLVVVRRKDWTEQDGIAYGLADNKTTDMSTFDDAVVSELLKDMDVELREFTSFDDEEIKDYLEGDFVTPEDELSFEQPSTNRPGEHHHLAFSVEMWITVNAAIERIREREKDSAISGSRAIELMAADWLSGN